MQAPPAIAQGSNRVLRVVPSADLAELDPTRGPNLVARIYQQMVFDTLFAFDSNLQPRPMMVESHSVSGDGLTYRFTLRPNLRFHDGSPVTTRDVVASIERWMNGTSIGGQLKSRLAAMARGGRPHLHADAQPALRPGGIHAGRARRADRGDHARGRCPARR